VGDKGEKLIEFWCRQPGIDAGAGRLVEPCSGSKAMISSAEHKPVPAGSQVQRRPDHRLATIPPFPELRITEWKNMALSPVDGQAIAGDANEGLSPCVPPEQGAGDAPK
jgi:hypothetical protein